MVYLLTPPILTGYGTWQVQGPISTDDASANLIGRILQQHITFNRIAVKLQPGNSALVFHLLQRLFEGTVLDAEQLATISWVPRNTCDSSFPRKREPRKIKALDSRLRGNDGFFELPSYELGWLNYASQSTE